MLSVKLLSNGMINWLPPAQRLWRGGMVISLSVVLGVVLSACGGQYGVATRPPTPASPPVAIETVVPETVVPETVASESVVPASPNPRGTLPDAVREAVLKDLSHSQGQPVARFRIEQAEPHTWPDGCLGLAASDQFCTQVLVSGWRVTITDGTRSWIYRTNANGSQLKPEP